MVAEVGVVHDTLFLDPSQCTQESIRLANGDITQEGRVEICIDNVWGAVCSDEWNKIDALIICKQLGLGLGGMVAWCYSIPLKTFKF